MMTQKELDKKVEKVKRMIMKQTVNIDIINELASMNTITPESEWEFEHYTTMFKEFSYTDGRRFIKQLKKVLLENINSKEFSWLVSFRIINALSIIGDCRGVKRRNPKLKFLLIYEENALIEEETFKQISLLDKAM